MQRNTVTVSDGATLSYLEGGSGHPLVMLPGWSQSAAEFDRQFEALCAVRRVIALDQRGHGESQKVGNGYRIQRLAKDLDDVIGALGLQQPDLLGHSMGCSVIWSWHSMFAHKRPAGKFVMVDQAPAVTAQADWSDAQKADYGCLMPDFTALNGFENAVRGAPDAAQTKEIIRGMFTAAVAEADLDWIASENIKLPRDHAAHLLHDHCILDWRSEIAAIRNPTLVVGAEASIFSAQSQRWIAERIPGAEVEIFAANDGGSHFMFFDNPRRFNERVAAFLAG
ncbi:MAG TPA: alpha/beta hydrolase [Rhizobiaceae bacterium]|nr:alpha/beta hydrolase [Rhizobiaceae bacterium]